MNEDNITTAKMPFLNIQCSQKLYIKPKPVIMGMNVLNCDITAGAFSLAYVKSFTAAIFMIRFKDFFKVLTVM